MATKPIVQPEIWASNALYTTGPFIGSASKMVPAALIAAEGHRPGAANPTPAEYENSQQNRITALCQWVFSGSSAGAADAHIVEANAAGRATVHGLTVNDLVNETAAAVFSASSGLNPALLVTCTAGAPVIGAALGNSAGSAFTTTLGTGATATGLDVIMLNTPAGGAGFRVQTDNLAVAPAINVIHVGPTAAAVTVAATGTGAQAMSLEADDDAALFADGGVAGSAAVLAVGKVTAVGVRGSGGPGGANGVEGIGTGSASSGVSGLAEQRGVSGTATDAADGFGVYGVSAAAATTLAGGVYGEGLGDGTGVFGESSDGYGGLFTADGDRPPLFLTSRITDPTSTLTGGLWHRFSRGLSTYVANLPRLLWHTAGGAAIVWDYDQGPSTANDSPDTILTCTLTGADSPVVAGTVWIMVTVEVGRTSGTPDATIEIRDSTAGVSFITDTIPLFQTAGAGVFERTATYIIPRPVSVGNRTFIVNIGSSAAGSDINWRNAAMAIIGVF